MQCQNPSCQGEQEFEHTSQEQRLLGEFGVDPQALIFCRQCRDQRRITHRNERTFFKRPCSQTGNDMWSVYPADSPYKIFEKDLWWGDSWDGLSFGRDFDFNRPFFQQFHELMLDVPRPSLTQAKNQNADFCNDANNNNDCYMVFTADDNVNCHYGSYINCKDCLDCDELFQCELCYDSLYCHTCNGMTGCEYCLNSSNCYFSSNLINCHNCVFCFGLRDQRNCIFNTEVSPDVFMRFILQRQLFRRRSYKKAKEMFAMFIETVPQRYMFSLKSEQSTGDRLINCKDCENAYSAENCVSCSNIAASCLDLRDCMDCWSGAYGLQKSFEIQTCLYGGFLFAGNFSNNCNNSAYIDNCQSCQDCFGCIGLKQKKYCIFNKEYPQEQYNDLRNKIIAHMRNTGEWGQFFPHWMSPYPYNATVAQLYYPLGTDQYMAMLQKSEELFPPGPRFSRNHLWSISLAKGFPRPERVLSPPDSLFEAKNDDILAHTYYDTVTFEPFPVMGRELALCQIMKVPLPDRAFRSRFTERFNRYNPRRLYQRPCQKTGEGMQTNFPPDSPYIVFSDEAWRASLQ